MNAGKDNLIWLDLEMTGLDPFTDQIIEIATVVTNNELEIIARGPVLAIYQPEDILNNMDEWNTTHHTDSGLLNRVRRSNTSVQEAEKETMAFLQQYVEPASSPMCGNSICQDRRFLARLMPELEEFFHYRNLDVSTIKELVCRWSEKEQDGFSKENKHLAMDDIIESIEELKYYRNKFFKL